MKITTPATAAALLALWVLGCASQKAQYVDSSGSHMVTTVGDINVQDFAQAADTMAQSLIDNFINPGKLDVAGNRPAVLAISRIVNSTSQQIDTDMLVKKIRIALNRTGKVLTTTTVGLGDVAEDPLASSPNIATPPDYTLSGKIIESSVRAGNVHQSSFVFQLSLTRAGTGLAMWEEEKTITKQGSRPSVGF